MKISELLNESFKTAAHSLLKKHGSSGTMKDSHKNFSAVVSHLSSSKDWTKKQNATMDRDEYTHSDGSKVIVRHRDGYLQAETK